MTDAPSARQLEMEQRVAREEARDRRTIMKVHYAASALLLISTLLAWESHPRVEYHGGQNAGYYVIEVSHTIGLATRPAGLFTIALGVLSLAVATRLRKVDLGVGWAAFLLSLGALAVAIAELIQLLLGRRNWLDDITQSLAGNSTLSHAIGVGVLVAVLASMALVANTMTYLWLGYRLWRGNPAVTD